MKLKTIRTGLACAVTVCLGTFLMTSTALAQSAPPAVNLNPSPLQQYGQALANDGITFASRYNGEFAANPSGGARHGAEFTGELNAGADFDMGKLVNIPGGTVHVLFTDRAGNNLASKSINNSVSVQQIYGDGQTYQLTIFSYEQKLFDDKLDINVGRLDIAEDTVVSPFYCDFQNNSTCGNPSFMGKDVYIGSSYYPLATWGGRLKFSPVPNIYFKTGIYQSAPDENPDTGHGFNWAPHSDGVQVPLEVGYTDTSPGAAEPNQYDIGAAIDRTHYTAPFYDAASPRKYGRSVVYLQAQQMVYQLEPNSSRDLYLFGVAMFGTAGQKQPSDYSLEAGGILQGLLPSRPLDYAGLVFNELHYNSDFLSSLYTTRTAEGGTQRPNANLIMMEVNYTAQLTPWFNLTPNLQYIVHPDGLGGLAYPKSNEKDVFVVGLQFNLDVANLLGLASK